MVQGKITEVDTPTVQLGGATPSELISELPPSSSLHFYAGCPSCHNSPNLSWLGTGTEICWIAYPVAWCIHCGLVWCIPRSLVLVCIPRGLVCIPRGLVCIPRGLVCIPVVWYAYPVVWYAYPVVWCACPVVWCAYPVVWCAYPVV